MKNYPLRSIVAIVILLVLAVGGGARVWAQEGETVFITSPAEGEVVSGLVTVTGAVDFPDFLKYELFLKSGDQLIWGATVYAPVINGDLAIMDTKTVLDGTYQIIIRKVTPDSNYTEFVGPTIIIENKLGAPQPFPEVEPSPLYSPVAGALARVRNCSGDPLEFDYTSPDGFCSAADLWIEPKLEDSPICPFVDILLTPCEYRGTAIGMGVSRGATYSFEAVAGKIYEITYPGGDRLFIGEVPGRERASTDVGGLDPDDPTRMQVSPVVSDATPAAAAPAPTKEATSVTAVVALTAEAQASSDANAMLPVSGRGTVSKMPFVIAGSGLIIFLIVGGVVAARKRG